MRLLRDWRVQWERVGDVGSPVSDAYGRIMCITTRCERCGAARVSFEHSLAEPVSLPRDQ
eukprot:gene7260-1784_t